MDEDIILVNNKTVSSCYPIILELTCNTTTGAEIRKNRNI